MIQLDKIAEGILTGVISRESGNPVVSLGPRFRGEDVFFLSEKYSVAERSR